VFSGLQLAPLALASGDGAPDRALLARLADEAARALQIPCDVDAAPLDVEFALDMMRAQLWSTPVLGRLQERNARRGRVILGVTTLDLYVPVLTFVFGEAQLNGPAALISSHRLRESFYGMPDNADTLVGRLLKELLHELGHTQGLRHCLDWRCVMSSAHTVERIDLRQPAYCAPCARAFAAAQL
jgi:archaemetzincin